MSAATAGNASKVLLATGLVDEPPELAGIKPLDGVSVHHCLYCDGFEYAGKPVAAYGRGDKGAELAVMMKHWTTDVVACSDGTEVGAQAVRKLAEHNIPLRTEPIRYLEGTDGRGAHENHVRKRARLTKGRFIFFDRLPSGVRLIRTSWVQT